MPLKIPKCASLHYIRKMICMKSFLMKSFWILAVSATLLSCKKSDSQKVKDLTNGSWKITAFTASPAYDFEGQGTKITDAYPVLKDCAKDNLTTYTNEGRLIIDEGKTKCDQNSAQSITNAWTFLSNESIIQVSNGQTATDYKLLALDGTLLKISAQIVESGTTYTFTRTYTH